MQQNLYALTSDDVDLIRQMAQEFRYRFGSRNRPNPEIEQPLPSDILVVKTPAAGIPPMIDIPGTGSGEGTGTGTSYVDNPGSALCDAYTWSLSHTTYPRLLPAGYQVRVYNLATASVTGNAFIPAGKDRYSRWVAIGSGAGGAGSYVVLTPSGGIPAISETGGSDSGDIPVGTGTATLYDDPGLALCQIYHRSGADLVAAGIWLNVYNPWTVAIPGTEWIVVTMDAWGDWWAEHGIVRTEVVENVSFDGANCRLVVTKKCLWLAQATSGSCPSSSQPH